MSCVSGGAWKRVGGVGTKREEGQGGQARRRGRWRRWLVRLFLVGVCVFYGLWVYPFWGWPFRMGSGGRVPRTPAWALECWVWEDDTNTAEAVRELLEGYARHDIPVRTVLIDSPWSTRYNDFQVDTNRYPDPAGPWHSRRRPGIEGGEGCMRVRPC